MAYADEVLADSPLAYWKLEESSGTSAADSSGNARSLTLNGGITWGHPTVMPNGLSSADFPSATTAHFTRAAEAWMASASFAVEAWIRPDTVLSYDCIISRENSGNVNRQWSLFLTDGKLNMYSGDNRLGATTLTAATAYHVGASYDSATSTLRYYVNGALDATFNSTSVPNSQTASPYDLFVGVSRAASPGLSFPFDGRINHVAYYPSALSGTRFAAHYAAGATGGGIGVNVTAATHVWSAASAAISVGTDTSNRMEGFRLGGYVINEAAEPAPASPPATYTHTPRDDMALYLPPPEIDEGGRIQ